MAPQKKKIMVLEQSCKLGEAKGRNTFIQTKAKCSTKIRRNSGRKKEE